MIISEIEKEVDLASDEKPTFDLDFQNLVTVEEKAALSSLEEAISSAETDSNLLDSIAPEETEIINFGTSGFENNFTSAVSQDNFELFEGAAVKKDSILDNFETEAVAEKVCQVFFLYSNSPKNYYLVKKQSLKLGTVFPHIVAAQVFFLVFYHT